MQSTPDMLADGFATLAVGSGLPPPVLDYLRASLASDDPLKHADIIVALARALEEATQPPNERLEDLATVVELMQPLSADETLAHLRFLRSLRSYELQRLHRAALSPLLLTLDTSSWSAEMRKAILELAKGATEVEVQQLAQRIRDGYHKATEEVMEVDVQLPRELWQGVEDVLARGPGDDATLLLGNLVRIS